MKTLCCLQHTRAIICPLWACNFQQRIQFCFDLSLPLHSALAFLLSASNMQCEAKDKCAAPDIPLPDRMKHFCALYFKEMHGCCGIFNDNKDAAPMYYNRCHDCDAALSIKGRVGD